MDSPDGDNGFPGNVKATVTYTLRPDNSLAIDYAATTDKPTVINMTNHSYFNLSGDASTPVTDNLLTVNASGYTPVDSTFMTTGEILAVEGTPMDFRQPRASARTSRTLPTSRSRTATDMTTTTCSTPTATSPCPRQCSRRPPAASP